MKTEDISDKVKSSKRSILFIFFLFLIFFIWYWYITFDWESKLNKCPTINPDRYFGIDNSMVDCYGIISVVRTNLAISKTQYFIEDDVHGNIIANINNLDQLKVIDDQLYVIDLWVGTIKAKYDDGPWQYEETYIINNKEETIYYDTIEEIPIYRVANIETGNMTLYNSFEEMSDEVKKIFVYLAEKHD